MKPSVFKLPKFGGKEDREELRICREFATIHSKNCAYHFRLIYPETGVDRRRDAAYRRSSQIRTCERRSPKDRLHLLRGGETA